MSLLPYRLTFPHTPEYVDSVSLDPKYPAAEDRTTDPISRSDVLGEIDGLRVDTNSSACAARLRCVRTGRQCQWSGRGTDRDPKIRSKRIELRDGGRVEYSDKLVRTRHRHDDKNLHVGCADQDSFFSEPGQQHEHLCRSPSPIRKRPNNSAAPVALGGHTVLFRGQTLSTFLVVSAPGN